MYTVSTYASVPSADVWVSCEMCFKRDFEIARSISDIAGAELFHYLQRRRIHIRHRSLSSDSIVASEPASILMANGNKNGISSQIECINHHNDKKPFISQQYVSKESLICSHITPTSIPVLSVLAVFQILDDEEDALAAAETEAQVASEEVAKALRRADPKPDGRSKDRVARLQRKAREAADRSVALRLIIEGPQAVQVRGTVCRARSKPGARSLARKITKQQQILGGSQVSVTEALSVE